MVEKHISILTVQELFRKADKKMVFNAYTLIEPLFDDLNMDSLAVKAEKIEIARERIFSLCDHICECDPVQGEKETIFVMERPGAPYEKQHVKEIDVFCVNDKEADKAVDKDFSLWDDEGEVRIGHFAIDLLPFDEVAAYNIAGESVAMEGIDVCCAAILNELCFWGTSIKDREKRMKQVVEELKICVSNQKNEDYVPCEEMFARLDEKITSCMSEDEKLYHQYKIEFKEKVRDIEERRMIKTMNETHKMYIDTIRREYMSRRCLFSEG